MQIVDPCAGVNKPDAISPANTDDEPPASVVMKNASESPDECGDELAAVVDEDVGLIAGRS